MHFNNYVNGNRISLQGFYGSCTNLQVSELISFLQSNRFITSVHLDDISIGCEGAKALADSDLKNLTELYLVYSRIGDEGAKALANGTLTNLTKLSLLDSNISEEGVEALAKSENLKNLTVLNLGNRGVYGPACINPTKNNIGPKGAKALADGSLTNLVKLNLSRNNISDEGIEALAKSGNVKNLTNLDLSDNNIGPEGAKALADGSLTNLVELDLSENNISDEGIEALAKGESLKNLTSLHLNCNSIGNKGAKALAKSEKLKNLTDLNLDTNGIGSEGAKALASGSLTSLTKLCLFRNNIGYRSSLNHALVGGVVLSLSIVYLASGAVLNPVDAIITFIPVAIISTVLCLLIGQFCQEVSYKKQENYTVSTYSAVKSVLFGVSATQHPEPQLREL